MMNETWTNEETVMYALTMTCLEEETNTPSEEEKAKELEIIEGEVEEVEKPPLYKRPIPRKWGILLCSCLLVLSTIVSTVLIMILTATATIEITLVKKPVSFQQTVSIPATRSFPDKTVTRSQSAPATGKGHHDATYAYGEVTFYNGAPFIQTVSAGTLLTGADGVQIVTEQDAIIPAVMYPTLGQTTVKAHAVLAGAGGNIKAGDIYGLCCRLNVSAVNSTFTGGQEARDFSIVAQQDIDHLATSLSSHIDQHISQELSDHIGQRETLTPPLCSQRIVPTPTVGVEATTVTVSITKTCSAVSYRKKDFVEHIQKQFTQSVAMKFGTVYIPVGKPHITIINTSGKENSVKITALVNGTIIYHFRKADMDTMKRLVAGKSKEQAGQILLKWKDIQLTGIQLQFNQDSFPSNPERITVKVKV